MKKVLLLGREDDLGDGLTQRMNVKGYSIKRTQNIKKALKFLRSSSPDFVLCTGTIKLDPDGNYYLDLNWDDVEINQFTEKQKRIIINI